MRELAGRNRSDGLLPLPVAPNLAPMPLHRELIELLACPKCRGKLDLRPDESAFLCPRCKLAYAVVDEIPNFIIEEAKPIE
jgi:uncharacterized protein YbaR (Trm112 family)